MCLQDKKKTDSGERVTNRKSVLAEKLFIGIIIIVIIIIVVVVVITAHESFKLGGGGGGV